MKSNFISIIQDKNNAIKLNMKVFQEEGKLEGYVLGKFIMDKLIFLLDSDQTILHLVI